MALTSNWALSSHSQPENPKTHLLIKCKTILSIVQGDPIIPEESRVTYNYCNTIVKLQQVAFMRSASWEAGKQGFMKYRRYNRKKTNGIQI